MDRYKNLFKKLYLRNEGAFVPFVILGDPSIKFSLKIIDKLISSGADALELGIPYTDPIADGPIIQRSTLRAISSGVMLENCFNMLMQIRENYTDIPIGLLIYANLVFNNGIEEFYAKCAKIGIDSVLIADVPMQESRPFRDAAMINGISPIFICPPNADNNLIREIAYYGSGYTYLLSRAGVTGKKNKLNIPIINIINKLNEYHAAPSLYGFGITEPSQVKSAIKAGTSGAISGSAIISIIENNLKNPKILLKNLELFIFKMKAATYK